MTGLGERFLEQIKDGVPVAIDGTTGTVYIEPDAATVTMLAAKRREADERKRLVRELKGKENITIDGTRISIMANIPDLESIGAVFANDASGIGLFKTEFLFTGIEGFPTEEQQFRAYRKALESMAGKNVVIRTLDLGSDRAPGYMSLPEETNPALGCRGIRLCLARPELLRTQLRALYRASAYGKLGIMFPMISSVNELKNVAELCREIRGELKYDGIPVSENISVGIMIETPAAALLSPKLAEMVDFFTVGTNDLTQYTLAYDRGTAQTDSYADPDREAVMKLIEMSAEAAHSAGKLIGVCGELAGDTRFTEKFLRLGVDALSVPPSQVLRVREKVRGIDLSE